MGAQWFHARNAKPLLYLSREFRQIHSWLLSVAIFIVWRVDKRPKWPGGHRQSFAHCSRKVNIRRVDPRLGESQYVGPANASCSSRQNRVTNQSATRNPVHVPSLNSEIHLSNHSLRQSI